MSEVLRGRVVTGLGDLAHWMVQYRELYAARAGHALFPGSLNVQLESDWSMATVGVRLEPAEYGGVGMNIAHCDIEGIPAFILRTDRNAAGVGLHPPSLIEIAAAVHLRTMLSLQDGSWVTITVPPVRSDESRSR